MNDKICCFTGHRKIPPQQYKRIVRRLKAVITALVKRGVIYFRTGGALGFDTVAAQTVLELKELYPQIKLILVLPCKTQTRGWNKADIATYEIIKNACDIYIYTFNEYATGCMHKRNRHLVDDSKYCICYLTQSCGGTAYTAAYAKKNGLTVINLAAEKKVQP